MTPTTEELRALLNTAEYKSLSPDEWAAIADLAQAELSRREGEAAKR